MRAPKKILGAIAGVAMLATTLGIGSAAFAASPTYYDIYDLTTLAQNAANGLFTAGIMNGTAPGKFSPDGIVTRAQAVKFVVNLSGVQLQYPKTPSYTDVTAGSQYYPYIETALADGFLTGYAGSSGSFDPSAPVTRVDLAILVINAMGDQSVAQSMATDTTTYKQFIDLSKVPSGDLGYANAGMKLGFVPPLNATLYYPNGKVNREQLAVGLWRAYEALQAAAPASATITSTPADVGVGQAATLSIAVMNKAGKALTASQLAGYTISYSVTGSNASSATVSANGLFVATAAGNYTVQASISGGVLSAPITATATVGVYGTPAALVVKPASASLVADGVATETVTVDVVDANGNTVGNFDQAVTLSDSPSSATAIQTSSTTTATSDTVNASNGVASFTLQSINGLAGVTETLTATATNSGTALTQGSATVATVAQVPTSISVSAASPYLTANTGGNTDNISATVDDQAGNPMLTGAYGLTFSVTGPATFAGSTTTAAAAFFGSGSASVTNPASEPIYSQPGAAGAVTVNVTSSNTSLSLKAGSASVQAVIVGVPTSLTASAASSSIAAGAGLNAPDALTVGLNDANGHPTTTATTTPVTVTVTQGTTTVTTFNGTIAAGQGSTTVNLVSPGANQTVPSTEINVGDTPGTYTITVTATGLNTATTTFTVTAGAAAALSLSPTGPNSGSIDIPYTSQSVSVSAQVTDAAGNPAADSGVPVTFTLSGTNGTASINGSSSVGAPTATVSTNAQGVATVALAFSSAAGATWTVTASATINGAAASVQGSYYITATPAGQVSVALKDTQSSSADNGSPSAALSGDSLSGTIQVNQANGLAVSQVEQVLVTVNPADGFTGGGTSLTTSSGTIADDGTPGQFLVPTNATGQITFTAQAGVAGAVTVSAKDESLVTPVTGSATMTVSPSTLVAGANAFYNGQDVSPNYNTLAVTANSPVAITVSPVDAAGNPILDASPLTVTLGDTATGVTSNPVSGGTFRTAPTGATITSVTIPANTAGVVVYYVNANSGNTYITATASATLTAAVLGTQTALANPTTSPTVTASSTIPTSLAAGNYLVEYAYSNANGDTVAAPFSQVTLQAGQAIQATAPSLPSGATGVVWYVSTAAGQTAVEAVAGATTASVTLTAVGSGVTPVSVNGTGYQVANPSVALTGGNTASIGGSLAASQTVYVTYAFTNSNGSTAAATAASEAIPASGTSTNVVTFTTPSLPSGATGVVYYAGTASADASLYQLQTADFNVSGTTLTVKNLETSGNTAPTANTTGNVVANPTTAPTLTAAAGAPANTGLAAGTYWVSYAWKNVTGTTVASPETAVGVSANQAINVTVPTVPAGATVNVYVSSAANSTTLDYYTTGSSTTYTVTGVGTGAAAPTTNTSGTVNTLMLTFSGSVTASTVALGDFSFAGTGASVTAVSLLSGSGTTQLVISYTGTLVSGNTVNLTTGQTDIKTVGNVNVAPAALPVTIS